MTDLRECLDVSAMQRASEIDGARVKAAGIVRVYARASDGVNWEDPEFKAHMAWVREQELEAGAYHFLRVRHSRQQDAEEQARQFCALYRREGCTATAVVDCELLPAGLPFASLHNASTDVEWSQALALWLNVIVGELGAAEVYGSPAFFESRPALADPFFAAHGLWIAHYGVQVPRVPRPWLDWVGWQYAASDGLPRGRVDGIAGDVDRSHFTA